MRQAYDYWQDQPGSRTVATGACLPSVRERAAATERPPSDTVASRPPHDSTPFTRARPSRLAGPFSFVQRLRSTRPTRSPVAQPPRPTTAALDKHRETAVSPGGFVFPFVPPPTPRRGGADSNTPSAAPLCRERTLRTVQAGCTIATIDRPAARDGATFALQTGSPESLAAGERL